MQAPKLRRGDTIGIFSPSHVAGLELYARITAAIERLGFQVKLGENIYKDTYGYAASAGERAEDLNALVADDGVKMILFSGGESAVEILPLIDYENICRHPKLFCSYSDGTSVLNAIHAQTGLVTYYGGTAGEFADLRHYDYVQFCSHFLAGDPAKIFISDSPWKTLRGGTCEGTLIGGCADLFAMTLANKYFRFDADKKYLLFLEQYEGFVPAGAVATFLGFIEQSALMQNVTGLIFGHYSDNLSERFIRLLERFGEKNNIPVVYTDDFGHGSRHAIFPIGMDAALDADEQTLIFK